MTLWNVPSLHSCELGSGIRRSRGLLAGKLGDGDVRLDYTGSLWWLLALLVWLHALGLVRGSGAGVRMSRLAGLGTLGGVTAGEALAFDGRWTAHYYLLISYNWTVPFFENLRLADEEPSEANTTVGALPNAGQRRELFRLAH